VTRPHVSGFRFELLGLPGRASAYNARAQARAAFLGDTVLPSYVWPYVASLNHSLMTNGARIESGISD